MYLKVVLLICPKRTKILNEWDTVHSLCVTSAKSRNQLLHQLLRGKTTSISPVTRLS